MLQILQKQLDESTQCPLCRASMYWVEAEQYDQELNYHECSYCEHKVYQDKTHNCHCAACQASRKKLIKEALHQENFKQKNKGKDKDMIEHKLNQLSFIQKLFLLAVLDDQVFENSQHDEFIDWEKIKYYPISPNYLYQKNNLSFPRILL